jgi:hypothetical protein
MAGQDIQLQARPFSGLNDGKIAWPIQVRVRTVDAEGDLDVQTRGT